MKIIEIRSTRNGEVAYLFDEQKRRVIKIAVEDFTRNSRYDEDSRGSYEVEEDFDVDPVPPRRAPAVRRPPELDDDTPPPPPPRKMPPKNSIVPPHLRGVFLPPDTPGAAVERRTVG